MCPQCAERVTTSAKTWKKRHGGRLRGETANSMVEDNWPVGRFGRVGGVLATTPDLALSRAFREDTTVLSGGHHSLECSGTSK